VTKKRGRRSRAVADDYMVRDPTPGALQKLLKQLDAHARLLPPDLCNELFLLVGWALVQVQDYQPHSRARIGYQRVAAVRDAIKRGLRPEKAYADAVGQLAGTPAACELDMMKKVFLAAQKARRRRPG
jgi:hypothetical protein